MQSRCKVCATASRWENGRFKNEEDKQKVLAANRRSYERNKEKHQKRNLLRNSQNKVKALEAHGSLICMRCGFDNPAALEFHHRDPSGKLFNISTAVQSPDKHPWGDIIKELEKCDVICANCHKIEHCFREYEVKKSVERKEDFLGQKGKSA